MMEIKGDYNKGAVYNDTLIGHDKKYIWKKRNPGDTVWEDGKLPHLVETRTEESHCLGPEDKEFASISKKI